MANDRWYPNPTESGSHDAWNIHTRILDQVYKTQDMLEASNKSTPSISKSAPASPAATIAGINIKATTPPAQGNTIRYNASTGEFEFGT